MKINSEKLIKNRQIVIGEQYKNCIAQSRFTVFLGIYNGLPYLDSLLKQLSSQEIDGFPLIVADNASNDGSWEALNSWPTDIKARTKLIRNPINLGGVGTLILSLNEVETPWLVLLHQDDIYLPNHLAVLSNQFEHASEDDFVFFTDMGTVDLRGQLKPTLIRQSWIADLSTRESSFIANLFQQSVSYPSAGFRLSGLNLVNIPWHSMSFPDTEITLLQAPVGKFNFVPERTMLYRVNPDSTSRELNPKERILGSASALARVMGSESFYRLCLDVDEVRRTKFTKAILLGIQMRLGDSPLCEMVKLIASETMALAWDYSEINSRDQILSSYRSAEGTRTRLLLEELGAYYDDADPTKIQPPPSKTPENLIALEEILKKSLAQSNLKASRAQVAVLNIIGLAIPLKLRRKVVSFFVRSYVKIKKKSAWNLGWNPKA